MVNITMNHFPLEVDQGMTILEAAKQNHIEIPTLCFLKDINEIGACRVCVVELVGKDRLVSACNTLCEEGMEILTNSPKVRKARKTTVELILSQHDFQCATCVRSQNCSLQNLANRLNILDIPYPIKFNQKTWDRSFPLIRNTSKCIKCMRCIQICDKIQSLNIWDVANTGSRTDVDVSFHRDITEADCSLCGQCITHCPVGALTERDDTQKVFDLFEDKNVTTVVQIAPAVRTAWMEEWNLVDEQTSVKKLVQALRSMGADYVFDTVFSADLTIMEEANEFLTRLENNELARYPMFTSCCPGWIRFIKSQYPELVPQLSSAKSPQQMFGATIKSYFAEVKGLDPNQIRVISIMPCTAKKAECDMDLYYEEFAGKDVDIVLTTRELNRMMKREFIDVENLQESDFDEIMQRGSGAGIIFGTTGGVMEAALRSAYYFVTKQNPDADAFREVRGEYPWKEATFDINGTSIRVAVVHGLGNTRKLIEATKRKEVQYEFVEVMACPGGCVGGGGQPIHDGKELAPKRAETLYFLDANAPIRFSHENPDIQQAYNTYFQAPLSHRAHALLHTDHYAWNMPRAPKRRSS